MINHPETGEPMYTMDELKVVMRQMVHELVSDVTDINVKKLWERLHGSAPFGEEGRPLDVTVAAPLSVAYVFGRPWIASVPISTAPAERKATNRMVQ